MCIFWTSPAAVQSVTAGGAARRLLDWPGWGDDDGGFSFPGVPAVIGHVDLGLKHSLACSLFPAAQLVSCTQSCFVAEASSSV